MNTVFDLLLKAASALGLLAMLVVAWRGGAVLHSFHSLTDSVAKVQAREEARDAAVSQLAQDVARLTAVVDGVEKRVELLEQTRRRA